MNAIIITSSKENFVPIIYGVCVSPICAHDSLIAFDSDSFSMDSHSISVALKFYFKVVFSQNILIHYVRYSSI